MACGDYYHDDHNDDYQNNVDYHPDDEIMMIILETWQPRRAFAQERGRQGDSSREYWDCDNCELDCLVIVMIVI